jgi:hypothetical protein
MSSFTNFALYQIILGLTVSKKVKWGVELRKLLYERFQFLAAVSLKIQVSGR